MDTASLTVPFISPQDLAARIDTADAPLILDVRPPARYDQSLRMLKGARRCAPADVAAFASTGARGEVIVYCVYGHTVSQEAAALLRGAGWNARFLAGGFEGGEDGVDASEDIAGWRATSLPVVGKPA